MQRSYARSFQATVKVKSSFSTVRITQVRRSKSYLPLPVPSDATPKVVVPDTHPLWGFFRSRQTMTPPSEDAKHGRSWTAEELRKKSFDDLHSLWIICLKERNILATQRHERRRQQIRTEGNKEAAERDRTVRRTMAGIKFVLHERFLAYQQAIELAKQDESISLKTVTTTELVEAVADTATVEEKSDASKITVSKEEQASQKRKNRKLGTARKAEVLFKLKAAEFARTKGIPVDVSA